MNEQMIINISGVMIIVSAFGLLACQIAIVYENRRYYNWCLKSQQEVMGEGK